MLLQMNDIIMLFTIKSSSRQQLGDHPGRFDAGEADVQPLKLIAQPRVIDAAEVEDRRMEIAHVQHIVHGAVAELVGGPVRHPPLDAAAP